MNKKTILFCVRRFQTLRVFLLKLFSDMSEFPKTAQAVVDDGKVVGVDFNNRVQIAFVLAAPFRFRKFAAARAVMFYSPGVYVFFAMSFPPFMTL